MQGVTNIFHRIGHHVTEKLRVLLKFWLTQGVFKSFSFLEVEKYVMIIRDGWLYQIGGFFGKIPNGLWSPPPSFSENYIANFLWQIWLHICEEVWWPDSMKCMHMPSSKCVLFWFFSIQLLKKHTLNPEFTLFVSISCSKSPV